MLAAHFMPRARRTPACRVQIAPGEMPAWLTGPCFVCVPQRSQDSEKELLEADKAGARLPPCQTRARVNSARFAPLDDGRRSLDRQQLASLLAARWMGACRQQEPLAAASPPAAARLAPQPHLIACVLLRAGKEVQAAQGTIKTLVHQLRISVAAS